MRRVGFFGGTFDPPHRGHLEPAHWAVDALGLDALVFVPAGSPPHKQDEVLSSFGHRHAMMVLATQDEPRFFVSDLEVCRPGPTYTIDSVPLLRREWPADESFFVLGSDSFAQLTTWHRWAELADEIHLVVVRRDTVWGDELLGTVPAWLAARAITVTPPQALELTPGSPPQVILVNHPPVPAAASELRARLRQGLPAGDLVPAEVTRYVDKYRLYQQGV